MKILCYNKATKRKKETKSVSNFQKRGQTNEQIKHRQQRERGWQGAVGIRQQTKRKEGTKSDDSFPLGGGSLKRE